MKLLVRSQNFRLQSETEEFAQRKLEGLARYLPNIREIRMELNRQENKRGEDTIIAQVTLTHERGAILRTEERASGFDRGAIEAAVNLALDKMLKRINRFKGKRDVARARSTAVKYAATITEIEESEDAPSMDGAEHEDAAPAVVVKRKHIPVGTMNEAEAIDQMELLGHTFFMYRDLVTGKINVVYKRRDGAYGVLTPTE